MASRMRSCTARNITTASIPGLIIFLGQHPGIWSCARTHVRCELALRRRIRDQHAVLLRNGNEALGLHNRPRAGLGQLQRIAAASKTMKCVALPASALSLRVISVR